jgi:hypothetical protein
LWPCFSSCNWILWNKERKVEWLDFQTTQKMSFLSINLIFLLCSVNTNPNYVCEPCEESYNKSHCILLIPITFQQKIQLLTLQP